MTYTIVGPHNLPKCCDMTGINAERQYREDVSRAKKGTAVVVGFYSQMQQNYSSQGQSYSRHHVDLIEEKSYKQCIEKIKGLGKNSGLLDSYISRTNKAMMEYFFDRPLQWTDTAFLKACKFVGLMFLICFIGLPCFIYAIGARRLGQFRATMWSHAEFLDKENEDNFLHGRWKVHICEGSFHGGPSGATDIGLPGAMTETLVYGWATFEFDPNAIDSDTGAAHTAHTAHTNEDARDGEAVTSSCGKCGGQIDPSVKFCETCGTQVESIHSKPKCVQCGHDLGPNANFCPECDSLPRSTLDSTPRPARRDSRHGSTTGDPQTTEGQDSAPIPTPIGSPGGEGPGRARFKAGQKVKCLWRDGEYWPAEIVGREKIREADSPYIGSPAASPRFRLPNSPKIRTPKLQMQSPHQTPSVSMGSPSPSMAMVAASPSEQPYAYGTWKYYIHFVDFNRRLEEWLIDDGKNIIPDPEREAISNAEKKKRSASEGHLFKKKRKYSEMKKKAGQHVQQAKQRSSGALIIEDEEKERHAGIMRNVERVEFGRHEFQCWYWSPFPKLGKRHVDKLWICDSCLVYHESEQAYRRHTMKCLVGYPPGVEIYRYDDKKLGPMSIFEVDGARMWEYSQNLCLLAKLFLDHKNLQYDTDPFYFYLFCQVGPDTLRFEGKTIPRHHVCGYFSVEKDKSSGHNLACILTLPPFQRIGLGKMLIAFSYGLSLKEGLPGTPEKPLSDLGYRSYHAYWKEVLIDLLVRHVGDSISIDEISVWTGMTEEDIVTTLNDDLEGFRYLPGGKHALCVTEEMITHYQNNKAKGHEIIQIDQARLNWEGHGDKEKKKK